MQQIASAFVGYEVPKSRGRGENLGDIRRRQSSNAKRWLERMNKALGSHPRGLEKRSAASFEEANRAAEMALAKLLETANAAASARGSPA
jgi:hypothetical protein